MTVSVVWLFLTVPWVALQCVVMVYLLIILNLIVGQYDALVKLSDHCLLSNIYGVVAILLWIYKNTTKSSQDMYKYLRTSINRLVTDGNTNLCCQGFVLVLFKVLQPIKLILNTPEIIRRSVCKVEILQVIVNEIEVLSSF